MTYVYLLFLSSLDSVASSPFRIVIAFFKYLFMILFLCLLIKHVYKHVTKKTVTVSSIKYNPTVNLRRARRREYWIASVIFWLVTILLSHAMFAHTTGIIGIFFLIALILYIVEGVKRCHDLGDSGSYFFIPFYDLMLLFTDGCDFENDYGPDPKGRDI